MKPRRYKAKLREQKRLGILSLIMAIICLVVAIKIPDTDGMGDAFLLFLIMGLGCLLSKKIIIY